MLGEEGCANGKKVHLNLTWGWDGVKAVKRGARDSIEPYERHFSSIDFERKTQVSAELKTNEMDQRQ